MAAGGSKGPLPEEYTWEDCLADGTVSTLEHPLFSTPFAKEEFGTMFAEVVAELTNETPADNVSFFFERDMMNTSHLVFRDADAREDLLDWVQEAGCMPSTKEVQRGEDKDDEQQRKDKEKEAEEKRLKAERDAAAKAKSRAAKAARLAERAAKDPSETLALRLRSTFNNLEKLRAKAEKAGPDSKPAKKLETTVAKLCEQLGDLREQHPERLEMLPEEIRESNQAVYEAAGLPFPDEAEEAE